MVKWDTSIIQKECFEIDRFWIGNGPDPFVKCHPFVKCIGGVYRMEYKVEYSFDKHDIKWHRNTTLKPYGIITFNDIEVKFPCLDMLDWVGFYDTLILLHLQNNFPPWQSESLLV